MCCVLKFFLLSVFRSRLLFLSRIICGMGVFLIEFIGLIVRMFLLVSSLIKAGVFLFFLLVVLKNLGRLKVGLS